MIGKIHVERVEQLGGVRARVKDAAVVLGHDAIQATCLAAKVSDALRAALLQQNISDPQSASITLHVDVGKAANYAQITFVVGPLKTSTNWTLTERLPFRGSPSQEMLDHASELLNRKSREDLTNEVHQQNQQLIEREKLLQIALQEAKAATEAKSVFLANMSHELRTPLNSILGFTKRLLKRLNGKVTERDLDALATVNRNGRHLLGLINDILDLSKIESGRMELALENCSLGPLLKEVCVQCEPLLADGKQSLSLDLPTDNVNMYIDATKVRQVVTNLVSNAIKYSDEGPIEVSVQECTDPKLGPTAVIHVRDYGQGMTTEQRAQLFQPFTRLKTEASKKAGGTGLGLTICAQYAEMHGGRIDVQSTVGDGSLFSLVLPRTRTRITTNSTPVLQRNLSLLLVDKDQAFAVTAASFFEKANVDLVHAKSEQEAEELLAQKTPDVVFVAREYPKLRAKLSHADVVLVTDDLATEAKTHATISKIHESIVRDLGKRLSKVLIVEDNPDARKLLSDVFSSTGAELVFAATGEDALTELANEPMPSVIILDLMLPGLSGFDVLAELHRTPKLAEIPTVVLSAMTLTDGDLLRLQTMACAILEKGEGAPDRAVSAALAATRA